MFGSARRMARRWASGARRTLGTGRRIAAAGHGAAPVVRGQAAGVAAAGWDVPLVPAYGVGAGRMPAGRTDGCRGVARGASDPEVLAGRRRAFRNPADGEHGRSPRRACATSACTVCSSSTTVRQACTGISTRRAPGIEAWKRAGRRMPVSVALGGDPAIPMPRRRRCPTIWTNTCWPGSCAAVP